MMIGVPPFYDQSKDKMYHKICNGKIKWPQPSWVSKDA